MTRASIIEAAAADWLTRREQPEWCPADQRELDGWLSASLEHKAAFWRLEHGWRMADRVTALDLKAPPLSIVHAWRRPARLLGAIAATILAVAGGVHFLSGSPSAPLPPQIRFATALGQHSTVPLADGSTLDLNTATRLRAAVSSDRREVWLDQGEAYFNIRHKNAVPFVIHVDGRDVTVLGTRFSVRRDGGTVRVAVIQGRVKLEDQNAGDAGAVTLINAGRVAVADQNSTLLVSRPIAELESELEWRDGLLAFDDTPLATAASAFNRYNRQKLVIATNAAADVRIGGSFRTSNVEAFAQLLASAYGFRIEKSDDQIRVTK